jgi:hypothetical protein
METTNEEVYYDDSNLPEDLVNAPLPPEVVAQLVELGANAPPIGPQFEPPPGGAGTTDRRPPTSGAQTTPPPTQHTPKTQGLALPEPFSLKKDILQPRDRSGYILGDGLLKKGFAGIIFAPPGAGKSIAALQMAVEWSAGLESFHIQPARPLRVAYLSTEDDLDRFRRDMAGIIASSRFTPELIDRADKNFKAFHLSGGVMRDLARYIEQVVDKHKVDLVIVNPLWAYAPGDAMELGALCYGVLDPVLKRTGVALIAIHHTYKLKRMDTENIDRHGHQWLAAGGGQVSAWARFMIQIEATGTEGLYLWRLAKGDPKEAGWQWDGKPTRERWFRWDPEVYRWGDAAPEGQPGGGGYCRLLEVLPGPGEPAVSRERVHYDAKEKIHLGKNKTDQYLKLLLEEGRVERIQNGKEALFRRKGD